MAQHFLLTAAARTLSIKAIYAAGDAKAYDTFRKFRWPQTDGAPVCPKCGSLDCYALSVRRQFTCSDCRHRFSVTSGTIFHGRKLKFVDLMAAICIIVNGAKGISALQLSRDLDVQHKTAFVLAHKLRQSIAVEVKGAKLDAKSRLMAPTSAAIFAPRTRKRTARTVALPSIRPASAAWWSPSVN